MRKSKILKYFLGIILTPFVLIFLMMCLLYVPSIQRWAVKQATAYASQSTGMDISLREVSLAFPLDLKLRDLSVCQDGDTLLAVNQAVVDLDFSHILKLQLGVDAIDLISGSLDTKDLIPEVHLSGALKRLFVEADCVDLFHQSVNLNDAFLEGCHLSIALRDTVTAADTTVSAPIAWRINIEQIQIRQSNVNVIFPGDTLQVKSGIRYAELKQAEVNLKEGLYRASQFTLGADSLHYDCLPAIFTTSGLDFNHVKAESLKLNLENIFFRQNPMELTCYLNEGSVREQSGLQVDTLMGYVAMGEDALNLTALRLKTPESLLQANVDLDFAALTPKSTLEPTDSVKEGNLEITAKGKISRSDIQTIAGASIPRELRKYWPDVPVEINVSGEGNVDSLNLTELRIAMPTTFTVQAAGHLTNMMDTEHIGGDVVWEVHTRNLQFLNKVFGMSSVNIPHISINADTRIRNGRKVMADAVLYQDKGRVRIVAGMDIRDMAYQLRANVQNLNLHNFLPKDSIYHLTSMFEVKGRGTDMLSARDRFSAHINVEQLEYGTHNLSDMRFEAQLARGKGLLELVSDNDVLKMTACAEAEIENRKLSESSFALSMNHIDLYALGMSRVPFSAGMVMNLEGKSDFSQTHALHGTAEAMEMVLADTVYHPLDINVDADFTPNSINLKANAGDLDVRVYSTEGLDSVLAKTDNFMSEIQAQMDSLRLNQDTLRTLLPNAELQISCGKNNPVYNVLRSVFGYTFSDILFHAKTSSSEGLNGKGHVMALNTGSVLLDTIQWDIFQNALGTNLNAKVKNGPKNRYVSFESTVHSTITPTGATANLEFIDAKGRKGVDIGLQADVFPQGLRIHFTPLNPIIAYRNFALNKDNFIQLTKDGRLDALVDLLADDRTGLKMHSFSEKDSLQDISLSVSSLNLGELVHVMPFAPDVQGLLHGDIHYVKADSSSVTLSTDIRVNDLKYNGFNMGNMGVNAIYFPNQDGSHYVDGIIMHNDAEIVNLSGKYWEEGEDEFVEAMAALNRLPLSLADAFVPGGMARLEGFAHGEVEVTGDAYAPLMTGAFMTDSMYIISEEYSLNFRVPNDSVYIKESYIDLNRIEAYAAGKTPLVLDGKVDFRDLSRINLEVDFSAKNYKLIDASKSKKATAYGRVFVDLVGRVWGTSEDLKMRGQLKVLGNTDATYILRDSPITVKDQLSDIVTFVDFSDTTRVQSVQTRNEAIDVQMMVEIEPAVRVHCLLSDDGSDYVDLQGGGSLNMTYDLQNDIRLWGKYTIQEGTMRYSIMAIPLNDFRIANGSYVEFRGDMMNPTLSIAASERVKASVSDNNNPRNVAFDVGLSLSQTLDDMGLEFTLEAPEDMTVQNQLANMTAEERGRMAVTMLVTGMYVSDEFSLKSGFSYANTLNTYLQSAINKIAGQALSTVDLNFGIENSTTTTGGTTTDYSFSFAKRFWGNRISVIIGGKVSAGEDAVNNGQTLIDNVSLEYKLDKSATRNVRLYYDREYESLLEGELTEMGAGVVFRKKSDHLRDLFRFRKTEKKQK